MTRIDIENVMYGQHRKYRITLTSHEVIMQISLSPRDIAHLRNVIDQRDRP